MHTVRQQRIVDLAHPHAGALLDALDRRFGGQPAVDRLVDAPAPAFIIGEHLVGLEHFHMLAALAEFGFAAQRIDLVAHLVEGAIDALALGLDILGHHLVDLDSRLVEHRAPGGEPFHQCESFEHVVFDMCDLEVDRLFVVDQFLVRDQFGQHHGGRLQRFDLDFLIAPRIDMLDAQHAHRTFAVNDRHASKGMELFFARFGTIGEIGMRLSLGQIERFDVLGDRPGQALAHRQTRHVDRFRIETLRRV